MAERLSKGQESARVLRPASILRQLDSGQRVAQVAENASVAPKTVRAIVRRCEEQGMDSVLYEKRRPDHARVLNGGRSSGSWSWFAARCRKAGRGGASG